MFQRFPLETFARKRYAFSLSQLENRRFSNSSSNYILSTIDKKGRVLIPIRLRAKLRFLEGMNVKLTISDNRLVVEKGDENG